MKRRRTLLVIMSALWVIVAAGCGGGAGDGGSPAQRTIVSGVASKGPIANGKVDFFALYADGAKGPLLTTAATDLAGKFTADLGDYTGPILAEVSGSYMDEATGQTKTIPVETPLRAAVANASGNLTMAVTPLTELAVKKAGNSLTAATITAANAQVSSIFKMDIIGILPVAPEAAVVGNATQEEKDYTLALATLSQMSVNMPVARLLDGFLEDLTSGENLSPATAGDFQSALLDFLGNTNNHTGVASVDDTNCDSIGWKRVVVTLRSVGALPDKTVIGGIEATLQLPAGSSLRYDRDTGEPLSDAIKRSGVVPSDALLQANYIRGAGMVKLAMINTAGFGTGEFATILCEVPAGQTVTANNFGFSAVKFVDGNGVVISDITAAVEVSVK